jgi:hypothetical protein
MCLDGSRGRILVRAGRSSASIARSRARQLTLVRTTGRVRIARAGRRARRSSRSRPAAHVRAERSSVGHCATARSRRSAGHERPIASFLNRDRLERHSAGCRRVTTA